MAFGSRVRMNIPPDDRFVAYFCTNSSTPWWPSFTRSPTALRVVARFSGIAQLCCPRGIAPRNPHLLQFGSHRSVASARCDD